MMNRKMTWAMGTMAMVLGLGIVAANEKPTPEYQAAMKGINAANGQLRTHIQAVPKDYDAIAADAAALKPHVETVGKFWTAKKVEDAMKMAGDLHKAVLALEAAAKEKNEVNVMGAAKGVTGSCMGCHTAHRERLPDGTFEIK